MLAPITPAPSRPAGDPHEGTKADAQRALFRHIALNPVQTATLRLSSDELATIELALNLLDERVTDEQSNLRNDQEWVAAMESVRHKLALASVHLSDLEGGTKALMVDCLSTGRNELAILLGHTENKNGQSKEELKRLWLNKVTGAGLPLPMAQVFLDGQLQEHLA